MNKLNVVRRIWSLCATFQWPIVFIFLFLFAIQGLNAMFPVILGWMVTASGQGNLRALMGAVAGWAMLGTLRTVIVYLRERFEIKRLDFELSRHLARISMEKFFNISMGQHHLGHSVIKRSVINKGEAAISGVVYLAIYELVPTAFIILLPLGLLLWKVPLVGLTVLLVIVCFTTYTIKYNVRFTPRLRALETLANTVSKKNGEFVDGFELVYVNVQEERVRSEADGENGKMAILGQPMWMSYIGWFYTGQWFITLSQAVCILISGYLAYRGAINPGMFVTLFMWIGSALGTLNNISNLQRNLAKNLAPIEKYFKFLDYKPDIMVPIHPIPLGEVKGTIEFRGVSFAYRPRTDHDMLNSDDESESSRDPIDIPALRNISFVLEAGKRYAFVGRSGAGKSTLVGLLLRAYDPQEGSVFVDGVNLRELDYRKLRQQIGLVPQSVDLFDETLRYNLTFGLNGSAGHVTDADLDRVADLARISEFSGKLEKKWDTMIGERGVKLSGGQRQRVGIARALIKNPHILIFDEATSSLDTENEAAIRTSIHEASVGKTTIIIAHRLATVMGADKIFVFDEGRLVGEGTHDELLTTNAFYQRLVQNQVIVG